MIPFICAVMGGLMLYTTQNGNSNNNKQFILMSAGFIMFFMMVMLYNYVSFQKYPTWKSYTKFSTNKIKYDNYSCLDDSDKFKQYYQKCNSKLKYLENSDTYDKIIKNFITNKSDNMSDVCNDTNDSTGGIADANYDLLCKLAACKTKYYHDNKKREKYYNFSINDFLYYSGLSGDSNNRGIKLIVYILSLFIGGGLTYRILKEKENNPSNSSKSIHTILGSILLGLIMYFTYDTDIIFPPLFANIGINFPSFLGLDLTNKFNSVIGARIVLGIIFCLILALILGTAHAFLASTDKISNIVVKYGLISLIYICLFIRIAFEKNSISIVDDDDIYFDQYGKSGLQLASFFLYIFVFYVLLLIGIVGVKGANNNTETTIMDGIFKYMYDLMIPINIWVLIMNPLLYTLLLYFDKHYRQMFHKIYESSTSGPKKFKPTSINFLGHGLYDDIKKIYND